MTIQEIKAAINRRDNNTAKYLFQQLKPSTNKDNIIFYAFPVMDKTWQLWFRQGKQSITVTFHFCPTRIDESFPLTEYNIQFHKDTDVNEDFLKGIREKLKAFRNEKSNWQTNDRNFFENMRNNRMVRQNVAGFSEFVRQELETLSNQPPADDFWEGDSNPWIEFSKEIDLWLERKENGEDVEDIKKYILKGDEENQELEKFRNPERGEGQIHLEIPPQPYIGNPKAPIWILLMNPSYSATDIYDMVCTDNDTKKTVLSSIKSQERRWYSDDDIKKILGSFFTDGSEKGLTDRQRLMNNQLKFDFSRSKFYVLDDAFHTVRSKEEIRDLNKEGVERLDGTFQGSYEWWSENLLKKDICSPDYDNQKNTSDPSKFFVLEPFPYHSSKFQDIRPWELSPTHSKFWVKMVYYALKKGKILLCRKYADVVKEIAQALQITDADHNQIFVSSSSRNASISKNNFISYRDSLRQLNETEKMTAKQHFDEVISKYPCMNPPVANVDRSVCSSCGIACPRRMPIII